MLSIPSHMSLICLLYLLSSGYLSYAELTLIIDNDKIGYIGQSEISLYCDYNGATVSADNGYVIDWYKALQDGWHQLARGGEGTGVVPMISEDGKYVIINPASLNILELDEDDAGVYKCTVTIMSPLETASEVVTLDVVDGSNQEQTSNSTVVDGAVCISSNIFYVTTAILFGIFGYFAS